MTVILVVHMTTDSDRRLGHESLFSRRFPAFVSENLSFATNECVRNDLFQTRIILSPRPRSKEIVFPRQKDRQIALNFPGESLKNTERLEKTSPDDQYHFLFHQLSSAANYRPNRLQVTSYKLRVTS
jgi:hypothetical protein